MYKMTVKVFRIICSRNVSSIRSHAMRIMKRNEINLPKYFTDIANSGYGFICKFKGK